MVPSIITMLALVACAHSPDVSSTRDADGGTSGSGQSGAAAGAGLTGSGGTLGTAGAGSFAGSGSVGGAGAPSAGAPSAGAGGAAAGASGSGGSGGVSGSAAIGGKAGGAGLGGSAGRAGAGGSSGSSLGGGGASTLFVDDFEAGAGRWMPDVDDGNDLLGNWAVISLGATMAYKQQTSYSDASWAIAGDLAWTDQRIDVKVQFPPGSSEDATVMLALRYRDRRNYYRFQVSAGGEMRLYRTVNGSSGMLGSYELNAALATGVWLHLAFSIKGTALTGLFALPPATAPSPVVMGTDPGLASGKIGLGTSEGAMAAFDDVRVSVPQ